MRRIFWIAAMAASFSHGIAQAGDSPEFRGPTRDGIYTETGLLKAWPEGGPELVWEVDSIGMGYASISVVGDTLYATGMIEEDQGYLFALNADGSTKWKAKYGTETLNKQSPGSRSTPTIDGDRIYLISGPAVVYCMSAKDGSILWQVDTKAKFGSANVAWDIAESLLVDGDIVYCTPGGPDATVVALNKMTGDTLWTSKGLSEPSAYCSPDIIEHHGRRILVTMAAKSVVGIEPDTGNVLWTHLHETDYDIHAVTPVYADGILYYTGGYKSGGGALNLSDDGSSVTQRWLNKELDVQHHGVILKDGYIYGTAHQASREMLCLSLDTGKVMWSTKEVSQGSIVYADGMLYVYEGPKKGNVYLIKASPNGFESTGAFKITKGSVNHWAHPVIANGRLYIRRGEFLFAYNIAAG